MPVQPLRSVLLAAALTALAGCALFRPPLTSAERLSLDVARLAEAPTDSARTAIALELIQNAGLTPVAGRQYRYGSVVAGLVPGRTPSSRDTLIIVAAGLNSPVAVPLIAAGARLAGASAQRGADPGRTILIALWAPGRTPEQGLADVRAFPLWPRGAVRAAMDAEPVARLGATPDQAAAALARRLTVAASATLFPTPSDTLLTP